MKKKKEPEHGLFDDPHDTTIRVIREVSSKRQENDHVASDAEAQPFSKEWAEIYQTAAHDLADEAELFEKQGAHITEAIHRVMKRRGPIIYGPGKLFWDWFGYYSNGKHVSSFDDWLDDLSDPDNCDCRVLALLFMQQIVLSALPSERPMVQDRNIK